MHYDYDYDNDKKQDTKSVLQTYFMGAVFHIPKKQGTVHAPL
jgi:hypothetical protein